MVQADWTATNQGRSLLELPVLQDQQNRIGPGPLPSFHAWHGIAGSRRNTEQSVRAAKCGGGAVLSRIRAMKGFHHRPASQAAVEVSATSGETVRGPSTSRQRRRCMNMNILLVLSHLTGISLPAAAA